MSTPGPVFPAPLVDLLHHRWSVPVVARLDEMRGAKFVVLVHALGVSRPTLRATLDALTDQGWVMANPGYGHPMRPEWILTDRGRTLGPSTGPLTATIARLGADDLAYRKWTLPVLWTVGHGHERFAAIQDALPDLSARALTLALKAMQRADLLERHVEPTFPPTARYAPHRRARRLRQALDALVRAVA